MNNKDFIEALAGKTEFGVKETQRMMNWLTNTMGDGFQEGASLSVQGFGSFEVKKKLEREIVNPSTGQRMLVPPKLVLWFRPSLSWKKRVAGLTPMAEETTQEE